MEQSIRTFTSSFKCSKGGTESYKEYPLLLGTTSGTPENRDRESAKEFKLSGMCSVLIRMLNFKQVNTSFLTSDTTLGDLDDFLLMIDITA